MVDEYVFFPPFHTALGIFNYIQWVFVSLTEPLRQPKKCFSSSLLPFFGLRFFFSVIISSLKKGWIGQWVDCGDFFSSPVVDSNKQISQHGLNYNSGACWSVVSCPRLVHAARPTKSWSFRLLLACLWGCGVSVLSLDATCCWCEWKLRWFSCRLGTAPEYPE